MPRADPVALAVAPDDATSRAWADAPIVALPVPADDASCVPIIAPFAVAVALASADTLAGRMRRGVAEDEAEAVGADEPVACLSPDAPAVAEADAPAAPVLITLPPAVAVAVAEADAVAVAYLTP